MTEHRAYWVERDALGQFRVTNADQSLKLYNGYRNEAEAQFDADMLSGAYAAGLAARDAEVARWKKCCEDMAPAETVRALEAEVERLTRRVQELRAALVEARECCARSAVLLTTHGMDPSAVLPEHVGIGVRLNAALSGAAPTEGGTTT